MGFLGYLLLASIHAFTHEFYYECGPQRLENVINCLIHPSTHSFLSLNAMLSVRGLRVQVMMASWGSLCGNMREQVFATLSLLDLGRAAPTCRDFRAAYKARLSAAHPAIVQKAASGIGEAFLRRHGTVMLRLSRGLDLVSGGKYRGPNPFFYTLGNRTLVKHRPDPVNRFWKPAPKEGFASLWGDITPGVRAVEVLRLNGPQCEGLQLRCVFESRTLRILAECQGTKHYAEAAGELAFICQYILVERARSSCRGRGEGFELALDFVFDVQGRSENGGWSAVEAELDGIAAALLPLSRVVRIRLMACSNPTEMFTSDRVYGQLPSLGKLQAICRAGCT
jgi:hypothetical protein